MAMLSLVPIAVNMRGWVQEPGAREADLQAIRKGCLSAANGRCFTVATLYGPSNQLVSVLDAVGVAKQCNATMVASPIFPHYSNSENALKLKDIFTWDTVSVLGTSTPVFADCVLRFNNKTSTRFTRTPNTSLLPTLHVPRNAGMWPPCDALAWAWRRGGLTGGCRLPTLELPFRYYNSPSGSDRLSKVGQLKANDGTVELIGSRTLPVAAWAHRIAPATNGSATPCLCLMLRYQEHACDHYRATSAECAEKQWEEHPLCATGPVKNATGEGNGREKPAECIARLTQTARRHFALDAKCPAYIMSRYDPPEPLPRNTMHIVTEPSSLSVFKEGAECAKAQHVVFVDDMPKQMGGGGGLSTLYEILILAQIRSGRSDVGWSTVVKEAWSFMPKRRSPFLPIADYRGSVRATE